MRRKLSLPPKEISQLLDEWSHGNQAARSNLKAEQGRLGTKEEREAAHRSDSVKSGSPMVLNAHAPAPQVVYYRPNAKVNEPMLVKVQLRYRPVRGNR